MHPLRLTCTWSGVLFYFVERYYAVCKFTLHYTALYWNKFVGIGLGEVSLICE